MYFLKVAIASAFTTANLFSLGAATPSASLERREKCAQKWSCNKGEIYNGPAFCAGKHDGFPGFWVCVDACWISEYEVRARLKVHNGGNDPSDGAIWGGWNLAGKGVTGFITLSVSNNLPVGGDECSDVIEIGHPFGNTKRILGINLHGFGPHGDISKTVPNPKIK